MLLSYCLLWICIKISFTSVYSVDVNIPLLEEKSNFSFNEAKWVMSQSNFSIFDEKWVMSQSNFSIFDEKWVMSQSTQSCSMYPDCQYQNCYTKSSKYGCSCQNYMDGGTGWSWSYDFVGECNVCWYYDGSSGTYKKCPKRCPETCDNGLYIINQYTETCECVSCIAGSFCVNGVMQTCEQKKYSDTGASVCIPCVNRIANSTLQNVASNSSQCPFTCNAGFHAYNSSCVVCPPNSYCTPSRVIPCANNTCKTCQVCPRGTVQNISLPHAERRCQTCQQGFYCPNTTVQIPCPLGSFCNSTFEKPCEAGYYCPNSTVQLPCPIGYYCPMRSTSPFLCLAGTFSNNTGLSSCYDCPLNTYNVQNGSSSCLPCESTAALPGKYRSGCGGSSPGTIESCTNSI